jgi:hypothetical protein
MAAMTMFLGPDAYAYEVVIRGRQGSMRLLVL